MPLLSICIAIKWFKCGKTKLIIDWHNYGYSIMRVNRVNSCLVFMAKLYETYLGKFADYHFCVTSAMKRDLVNRVGIPESRIFILYDKAT